MTALVLTYHAVEDGPPPLCIEPELFRAHVAVIEASGAVSLTVSELAAALRSGKLPGRTVSITFDDGCASVVEQAAPVLREHGMRATVFCVAGSLGAHNDWPTQAAWVPRLRLASAAALRELADDGWELGSHGVEHSPLDTADEEQAHHEVVDSRLLLEQQVGVGISSFAWPYGVRPSAAAGAFIAATYGAACGAGPGIVRQRDDVLALARVDAHYLRSPALLRWALKGSAGIYLTLRSTASRVRRGLRPDHA